VKRRDIEYDDGREMELTQIRVQWGLWYLGVESSNAGTTMLIS
jgi:hypothetical protein